MAYVPRVAISVPPNRDYQMTLTQTKMVYDNLLADKHGKLFATLIRKKEQFDKECYNIEKTKGRDAALEYGVRAQEQLNKLQGEVDNELLMLQQDYQSKINKMHAMLEDTWRKQNGT